MPKNIAALIIALQSAAGTLPDWLHLLPATEFSGVDGRGPYAAPDMNALISAFAADGRKLAVDENHSIDLAGKAGLPSPARGWIVELQAREDGLWGRVEWTDEGAALVQGKAYGYLSPVFQHSTSKPYRIAKVLRVALTNSPNLEFLTSLHHQRESDMLEQLRKALGLPETATEAEILHAVSTTHAEHQAQTALMGRVRAAAGLAADVTGDALVTALQSRGKASPTEAENAQLQATVTALQSQLTTLVNQTAKDKAVTTVEAAIKAGKIVPALRDHMISRHMRAPEEVEAEIKLMPSLNAGGLGGRQPPENGAPSLTEEDRKVAAMMGVDEKTFADRSKALHGKDL
ncbi:Mu-like prophage I protein [Rhizobium sp. RU35A]|uniref:phage protease n=1 Tax=Rhizobium sp. RU35A TaxID=1907414 RepID=UPI000953EC83|nr:phage protease [Rhizobium sp. RU35A]SIQ24031.1 Mu-like prophage I protein [Rhizobium sp. RU35A]